jgi:hypothetical protein
MTTDLIIPPELLPAVNVALKIFPGAKVAALRPCTDEERPPPINLVYGPRLYSSVWRTHGGYDRERPRRRRRWGR